MKPLMWRHSQESRRWELVDENDPRRDPVVVGYVNDEYLAKGEPWAVRARLARAYPDHPLPDEAWGQDQTG